MKQLVIILIILSLSVTLTATRKALVIGNASYTTSALRNPVNDANAVQSTLQRLGFTVTLKTNLDKRNFDTVINNFTSGLQSGDEVVFYYSGDGTQVDGENYLIPTGAEIVDEVGCKYDAVNCSSITERLQKASVSIIVLDACRDNPYRGVRSANKGLARMECKAGTQFIIYSTEKGKTATDGSGNISPFTEVFTKQAVVPDRTIEEMMRDVVKEVRLKTGGRQVPYSNGNLEDPFYFAMSSPNITPQTTIKLPVQPTIVTMTTPQNISGASIDMVYVEGGTFTMGDTAGGGSDDEKPTHSVTLSSYYIGKYEVTQKQWQDVMGSNPSIFKGDNKPVEEVRWYDILVFCNKLSSIEGLTPCYSINGSTNPNSWGAVPTSPNSTWDAAICNWSANGFRLPTEAEWEYAAKGGKQSNGYKYAGSNDVNSVAVCDDKSYDLGSSSADYGTHMIGSKQANELGIYDMSGNVWEWCWDWYNDKYYSNSPNNNPLGAQSGTYRVLRGGSWGRNMLFNVCRVSIRSSNPYLVDNGIGFRLSRVM